jgi:hypothetical protein
MQPVDVLGEEHLAPTAGLEPGQGVMRVVGKCLSEVPPTDQAARPIAAPDGVFGDKRLKAHRLCPFPTSIGVPIVGYPGIRAAAGSRQDE